MDKVFGLPFLREPLVWDFEYLCRKTGLSPEMGYKLVDYLCDLGVPRNQSEVDVIGHHGRLLKLTKNPLIVKAETSPQSLGERIKEYLDGVTCLIYLNNCEGIALKLLENVIVFIKQDGFDVLSGHPMRQRNKADGYRDAIPTWLMDVFKQIMKMCAVLREEEYLGARYNIEILNKIIDQSHTSSVSWLDELFFFAQSAMLMGISREEKISCYERIAGKIKGLRDNSMRTDSYDLSLQELRLLVVRGLIDCDGDAMMVQCHCEYLFQLKSTPDFHKESIKRKLVSKGGLYSEFEQKLC